MERVVFLSFSLERKTQPSHPQAHRASALQEQTEPLSPTETPSSGLALIPASWGTENLLPFLASCPEAQAAAGLSVWRGEGWGMKNGGRSGGGAGETGLGLQPPLSFSERGFWSFFHLEEANSPQV